MSSDIPPLRPAEKNNDPVIARCKGWVVSQRTVAKGYLEITFAFDKSEKYHAMRLTDFPGLMTIEARQPEIDVMVDELDEELRKALGLD